jgi:hypothetical protein
MVAFRVLHHYIPSYLFLAIQFLNIRWISVASYFDIDKEEHSWVLLTQRLCCACPMCWKLVTEQVQILSSSSVNDYQEKMTSRASILYP